MHIIISLGLYLLSKNKTVDIHILQSKNDYNPAIINDYTDISYAENHKTGFSETICQLSDKKFLNWFVYVLDGNFYNKWSEGRTLLLSN